MEIIGIDLGGTKSAGAIFRQDGNIVKKVVNNLEGRQGRWVSELIMEQIKSLLKFASENKLNIKAIGISVPGIYYSKSGKVWAPNISGWDNYPLLEEIQSMLNDKNIIVKIDSDRRLTSWAKPGSVVLWVAGMRYFWRSVPGLVPVFWWMEPFCVGMLTLPAQPAGWCLNALSGKNTSPAVASSIMHPVKVSQK